MKVIRKFNNSSENVVCYECGRTMLQVHWSHLKRSHDMSVDEYKKKYKLLRGELLAKSMRLNRQKRMIEFHKKNPNLKRRFKRLITKFPFKRSQISKDVLEAMSRSSKEHSREYFWAGTTPEQRSKEISRRNKKYWDNAPKEARKAASRRMSLMKKGKPSWCKGLKLGPMSEKQKAILSIRGKEFWKNASQEYKDTRSKKLSNALKGRKKTEEHLRKLRLSAIARGKEKRCLTDWQVNQIRVSYKRGKHGFGTESLAKRFAVSPRTVWEILNGRGTYNKKPISLR